MLGRWGALAVSVILLSAAVIFTGSRLQGGEVFDTDIQSILPNRTLSPAVRAAVLETTDISANRVAFLVQADTPEIQQAAMQDLAGRLDASGLFVNDFASAEETARWIYANREDLLCETDAAAFDAEAAASVRREALAKVYGFGAPVSGDLLRTDPFLLTLRLADCLSAGMVAGGQSAGLLTGRLTESAYRIDTQDSLTGLVADWASQWTERGVTLARMGAVFYAAHAGNSARWEISVIGLVGLTGVVLLLGLAFRRLSSVLLVVMLIGLSFLSGLCVTLIFFPKIHVLVMVFAAMLVGVVSDYAVHTFAARASNNWPGDAESRRLVGRPITVSMLTTAAGFAGLWFLNIALFAQLAVFAVTGVVTAWLLVQGVLVPLDVRPRQPDRAADGWAKRVRAINRLLPRGRLLPILCSVFMLLTVGGILRHTTLDDVRQFQPRSADLTADEEVMRTVLPAAGAVVYLVSEGETLEAAKAAEEAAVQKLLAADPTAVALAYTRFDPSDITRAENRAAIETRLKTPYLDEFRKRFGLTDAAPPATERPARPDWLEALHVTGDQGQHFLVAQLNSVTPGVALDVPGAVIVDIPDTYSQAFAAYRKLSTYSLLIASLAAAVFVLVIYRSWRALLIIACPCAAMLAGIFIPAVFGFPLSFFSIAAAMVLFGIGIDYAAFIWEASEKQEDWSRASVLIGAVTTELSMGLLSLSETYPVSSFGLTIAVGVPCALIYALTVAGFMKRGLHS